MIKKLFFLCAIAHCIGLTPVWSVENLDPLRDLQAKMIADSENLENEREERQRHIRASTRGLHQDVQGRMVAIKNLSTNVDGLELMKPRKSQIFASLIKNVTPYQNSYTTIVNDLFDILTTYDIADKPTLQDLSDDKKLTRCTNWKQSFGPLLRLQTAQPDWQRLTNTIFQRPVWHHGDDHLKEAILCLFCALNRGPLTRDVVSDEDTDNEQQVIYRRNRIRDVEPSKQQQKKIEDVFNSDSDE